MRAIDKASSVFFTLFRMKRCVSLYCVIVQILIAIFSPSSNTIFRAFFNRQFQLSIVSFPSELL